VPSCVYVQSPIIASAKHNTSACYVSDSTVPVWVVVVLSRVTTP